MVNQEELVFRFATYEDSGRLFNWRNHPNTRIQSISSSPIDYQTHKNWISAKLEDIDSHIFIAIINTVPIGMIRLDKSEDITISWMIAPDHQGRGLGKLMLKKFSLRSASSLKALIKTDNIASASIAKYSGYIEDGQEGQCLKYYYHPPSTDHKKLLNKDIGLLNSNNEGYQIIFF